MPSLYLPNIERIRTGLIGQSVVYKTRYDAAVAALPPPATPVVGLVLEPHANGQFDQKDLGARVIYTGLYPANLIGWCRFLKFSPFWQWQPEAGLTLATTPIRCSLGGANTGVLKKKSDLSELHLSDIPSLVSPYGDPSSSPVLEVTVDVSVPASPAMIVDLVKVYPGVVIPLAGGAAAPAPAVKSSRK